MPASVASAPVHRSTSKPTASRTTRKAPSKPSTNGASKEPKENGAVKPTHHPSPYEIMASRIANRVAEMAENYTFVERQKPSPRSEPTPEETKRKPRKLDIRVGANASSASHPANITFSAPFLDNTLTKLLALQNRMLKVSAEIAEAEDVEEGVKKEQYNQTAELSRIIALICAEKARQGS